MTTAESGGRALLRHGSLLSLLTLGSRVLGLLREMVKAALLGTSALSDAFSVAFMIPNLLRRLFAEGSISVAFIPTFKEYLLEGDREKTRDFLSCFFTFLTFFVTIAVAVGILVTPLVVPLFGMEEFDETVFLTRLMFPFLGFISLAALFQGVLNSLRVFGPSGLAPILLNLATILCAYALSPFMANPARAMAVGVLLGGFLEAAIQFPFVLKNGQRFFFAPLRRAFKDPGTRKVLALIGPTIAGMAAYQLNDLVSTALAGNAGEGVVSSLQYSLRLQELILGVFAVSIGTVLLPDLAEYAKAGQSELFDRRLNSGMNIIALITVPITVFALVRGENLIRLLFQGRNFDDESVRLTLSAFRFHIPGLYFIALNRVLAPAFYARSDTRSPTLAGIISFGVNMALAALLARTMKGAGIALALTLASVVNTLLLFAFLRKKAPLLYSLKLLSLSLLAAIPAALLGARLDAALPPGRGNLLAALAATACVYGVLGIGLLVVTRDKQLVMLRSLLTRRGGFS